MIRLRGHALQVLPDNIIVNASYAIAPGTSIPRESRRVPKAKHESSAKPEDNRVTADAVIPVYGRAWRNRRSGVVSSQEDSCALLAVRPVLRLAVLASFGFVWATALYYVGAG